MVNKVSVTRRTERKRQREKPLECVIKVGTLGQLPQGTKKGGELVKCVRKREMFFCGREGKMDHRRDMKKEGGEKWTREGGNPALAGRYTNLTTTSHCAVKKTEK